MHLFKDKDGQEWSLSITVGAVKRVRSLTGFDLLTIIENDGARELLNDPIKLVDVIFAICKPEAEKRSITDEDFGELMLGDAISSATDAMIAELIDFFPSRKDRENLKRVFDAATNVMDKARDRISTILDVELPKLANLALENAGKQSIAALGSSESTRNPSN